MKKLYWLLWIILTGVIAGFYLNTLFFSEDKSELLIGEASHGHYQIELACSSCHVDGFGGQEALQQACVNCHGDELKVARDSHPKKKFTDPRNANLIEVLDARYCVSCHNEHQREQTQTMGLTVPGDYCFHCHEDVGKNRDSHKELPFDSCASSGCHNFHDNRALYEDFLVANAGAPWLSVVTELAEPNSANKKTKIQVKNYQHLFSERRAEHPVIEQQWLTSGHGKAGIECESCHSEELGDWLEKPNLAQCESCHQSEAQGFLAGKHGMRLAAGLSPLAPHMSALPFKSDTQQVEHGCTTCHGAHSLDTKIAAMESCLGCHDDNHSRAYKNSPHGLLTERALAEEIPWGQAVTCATCHMPRVIDGQENSSLNINEVASSKGAAEIRVQHNQSDMLRPNEKMIRPVCMSCHSLEFSIDALADEELIQNNFKGKPQSHIPSIDWAIKRAK